MDVVYGAVKTVRVLDDNGSTVQSVENIRNGEPVKPMRRTYEIKTRVHSPKEEQEEYLRFSQDIEQNPKTMLDPVFRIERSKEGDKHGYYYVAKCHTRLEY